MIEDFVRESNRIEGITRDPLPHEIEAHKKLLAYLVTVAALKDFVSTIQPGAVIRDRPGLNVQVGNHIAPSGGPEIVVELENLLTIYRSPHQQHLLYENLHPFTDGNGRSGRALWLWRIGGIAPIGFLHQFYYDTLETC